jgi:hypothetical protein
MSIAYEQKAAAGLQQLGLTTAYDQLGPHHSERCGQ